MPKVTAAAVAVLLLLSAEPDLLAEGPSAAVGIELVPVRPGSFWMGGTDPAHDDNLRHKVTISRPFLIGRTEVTQAQFQAVMGYNPSRFPGPDRPVECVSWNEAAAFADRLGRLEGRPGFRLPTEAEWEYAARAGTEGKYLSGRPLQMDRFAWFGLNSGGSHRPVGLKEPNSWGLRDVSGNVWEWVADWYDKDYYGRAPEMDPAGPATGTSRIFRGGAWPWPIASLNLSRRGNYSYQEFAGECPRSGGREGGGEGLIDTDLGFRVAFSGNGELEIEGYLPTGLEDSGAGPGRRGRSSGLKPGL
ncbi:MAG: formylglycine-generating enzyme family protein [Deltaproteobacteria bacterium]|jgi:formylglycine-generating enzyme required for sulfatase activity|nr:formylglycine-generating enzyme family protein [Deltaproteobacteria bacterium]